MTAFAAFIPHHIDKTMYLRIGPDTVRRIPVVPAVFAQIAYADDYIVTTVAVEIPEPPVVRAHLAMMDILGKVAAKWLEGGGILLEPVVHHSPRHHGRRAVGRTVNGFYVFAKQIPSNYQEASDCPPWDQLSFFNGETYNSKQFYSCSCSQGILGARCRHLANLMLHLEKEHGPFVFTETEEELQARIRAEEEERERKHREAEERKEKLRLEAERKAKEREQNAAITYIRRYALPVPAGITFPPDAILQKSDIQTNMFETEKADRIMSGEMPVSSDLRVFFNDAGFQSLAVRGSCGDDAVSIVLDRTEISELSWKTRVMRQTIMLIHFSLFWCRAVLLKKLWKMSEIPKFIRILFLF